MYAKLFSRITESSLMETELPVRYTFIMLLAIADPQGFVVGTDIAIARRLNMDVLELKRCLHILAQPDPDSNSKEEGGRRVLPSDCERGYRIVNYIKYRDLKDEEHRRDYMRDYMRRYRAQETPVNFGKQVLVQEEAEEAAPAPTKAKKETASPWLLMAGVEMPEALRTENCLAAAKLWLQHKKEKGDAYKPTGLKAVLTKWSREFSPAEFPVAVDESIARGWQGVFWPKDMPRTSPPVAPKEPVVVKPHNAVHGPNRMGTMELSGFCRYAEQMKGTPEYAMAAQVAFDNGAVPNKLTNLPRVPATPLPLDQIPAFTVGAATQGPLL